MDTTHTFDSVHALAMTLPMDLAVHLVGSLRIRAIAALEARDTGAPDDGGDTLGRELEEAGNAVIRARYFRTVARIAADIAADTDLDESDDVAERIRDAINGIDWITYTAQAEHVLRVSTNWDAAYDVGADIDGPSDRAYYAMEQDIAEAVERLKDAASAQEASR